MMIRKYKMIRENNPFGEFWNKVSKKKQTEVKVKNVMLSLKFANKKPW